MIIPYQKAMSQFESKATDIMRAILRTGKPGDELNLSRAALDRNPNPPSIRASTSVSNVLQLSERVQDQIERVSRQN